MISCNFGTSKLNFAPDIWQLDHSRNFVSLSWYLDLLHPHSSRFVLVFGCRIKFGYQSFLRHRNIFIEITSHYYLLDAIGLCLEPKFMYSLRRSIWVVGNLLFFDRSWNIAFNQFSRITLFIIHIVGLWRNLIFRTWRRGFTFRRCIVHFHFQ